MTEWNYGPNRVQKNANTRRTFCQQAQEILQFWRDDIKPFRWGSCPSSERGKNMRKRRWMSGGFALIGVLALVTPTSGQIQRQSAERGAGARL